MLAAAILIYFFSIRTGDHIGGVQISEPRSAPEAVDIAPGARKLRQSFVPRLAVLPTERLKDDRQTQLLTNLLTESIAEYFQNNVIQVASVSEHDRVLTPREIGEKHQVGYVVYLKLGHDGNQFQQSNRITEAIYGTDLGARTITATGTEIHNVQEKLARDVHLIETSIIEAERMRARLITKDDQNPWEMLWASLSDRETQILRLEKVIQKNSVFHPAIASLANNYYWWGVISQRSKGVAAENNRDLELAQRAYSIAPKNPYYIETVMVVERSFGQHKLAVGLAEIVLRNRVVNSGDPYLVLIAEGRSEEVLEHAKHNPRAGLEPQGRAHIELGNYAEVEAYARQALLSPGRINHIPYWMVLADALGHQGRIDEGREVFDNIPGFNFEGYLRSQLDYWGDDHTHLKFLRGIEKLGYAIPSVEVVR